MLCGELLDLLKWPNRIDCVFELRISRALSEHTFHWNAIIIWSWQLGLFLVELWSMAATTSDITTAVVSMLSIASSPLGEL